VVFRFGRHGPGGGGVTARLRQFLDGRAWTHAEVPGALFPRQQHPCPTRGDHWSSSWTSSSAGGLGAGRRSSGESIYR
jgi:hypothetical protein